MGGKKGGEMGVVRDIPSDYYSATWVFPCFNKAEFRHFKELTPLVPCSEPFDPTLMKRLPQLERRGGQAHTAAAPRHHAGASGGFQRTTPLLRQPLSLC